MRNLVFDGGGLLTSELREELEMIYHVYTNIQPVSGGAIFLFDTRAKVENADPVKTAIDGILDGARRGDFSDKQISEAIMETEMAMARYFESPGGITNHVEPIH